MDAVVATELLELADRIRRVPPPSRRQPHSFTEVKDDIAAAIEAVAKRLCPGIAPLPPQRDRRTMGGVRMVGTITVGRRQVMVQRRVPFAIG